MIVTHLNPYTLYILSIVNNQFVEFSRQNIASGTELRRRVYDHLSYS